MLEESASEPLPLESQRAGLGTCGAASNPAVDQSIRLPERSALDRWIPSVRAPTVPQLHLGRPDLPGPMPPHPGVRVAIDERELIPHPHPPGHQVKAGARPLWGEPVPSRQHPWWRAPSARRQHQARLRGNRPAPPGFGCWHWPLAAWCEPGKPARTTRPSHVPMMPMARCHRCDARRSRPGPRAVELSLTCMLSFGR
jgi:hypothetical protein